MAEKILIVDDDIDSLKLIGLMLNRQGYEISAANSGMQALAKAGSERPDLIILDVMMPDMDGYEICRRLRTNPATQPIPIIMFTAKTMIDDKVAGFEAGADDYLTKPTHPAELASRVKAILLRSASQRRATADGGLLVGFLGVKGGVGTSTLAANVAAAFQQKEPTVLADLRVGQGSLALLLNVPRSAGMNNLLTRQPTDINQRIVENELTSHPSGLKLLLSSPRVKDYQVNINIDSAVVALKHLRSVARHVIVDLGASLTRQSARIVRETDQLVVVVEPYRHTLIMARDLLKELETMGLGKGRTNVVLVNRSSAQVQVPWQEAETLLDHEIMALVMPAAELAVQAAEAGTPMVLFQPTSIVATQMMKLAEELAARGQALAANA